MEFINTACTKLFCFLVERIYRELLYLFGIGRRYEKEDSKRGAVYVKQLLKNVADDGRYKLHPFHSNTSLMGFEAWLGFITVKWEIKLCHGGISGLKTVKQADFCSLTMMKDLMHVNTSLSAGPIDLNSWVIVSFLGFEHGFFVKGTLSRAKFLCDFTVNSETNKCESFDYLLIREIKGMKIWVQEGLGLLKWPVNLAVHLVIVFLKPFIRNAVEYLLENLVKDDFSNYEFPVEGKIETSLLEESSEHNEMVMEHVLESDQIAQPNTFKIFPFSYWWDTARSYLRRKPPVIFIDCPINSECCQSKETTENEGCLEGNALKNKINCPSITDWASDYKTPIKEQSLYGFARTPYKKQTDEASKLAEEMKLSSNEMDVAGSKLCQTVTKSSTVEESSRFLNDLDNPLTVMKERIVNKNTKRVNLRGYLEGLGCRDISGFSDQYSNSKDSFVYLLSYSSMMPKSTKGSTDAVELGLKTDVEAEGEKFLLVVDKENSTDSCVLKVKSKSDKVEKILPSVAETTTTCKLEAASGGEDSHRNTPYKGETERIEVSVPFEEMSVLKHNAPLELRELQPTNPKSIPDRSMQKENSPLKQRGLKLVNPKSIPEKNILKQNYQSKIKMEHATDTNKSVEVNAEEDIKGKLSFKVERDATCESGILSEEKCSQAKLPLEAVIKPMPATNQSVTAMGPKSISEGSMHQENCLLRRQGLQPESTKSRPKRKIIPLLISHLKAKIESLAATNEPVDVTAERSRLEKLLIEAEMCTAFEACISSKYECSLAKLQLEGKIEHISATNESVVSPKSPKSVPERKVTKEKSPPKRRGLKPANLKSRPVMVIYKHDCHSKTKIEPATASSDSVDVTIERNEEKLPLLPLEVKMDKTCETGALSEEECDQAMLSVEAKIEPVVTSNEPIDGTTEGDFEDKLLLEKMDAACKAGVAYKGVCSKAKLPLEGKIKPISAINESVVVTAECPKSIPERKIRNENFPQKLRGLKPVNLKSRPEMKIPKQSYHLKTKIEPVTASKESVDVITERNGEEKLPLEVEMAKTCETRVSSKEECAQVMLPLKAKTEPVTGTNESADVTTEANVEEKLLEVEMDATCEARVSSTEKCSQEKLSLEPEIEPVSPVSSTNEFVVVTREEVEMDATCEAGVSSSEKCFQSKLPLEAEIEPVSPVSATNEFVVVTAEGPKFIRERKTSNVNGLLNPGELKPMNLSILKRNMLEQTCPSKTKIEHVTATIDSVDETAEGDIKEKLLDVEMDATCESAVSPKQNCAQAKSPFKTKVEPATTINGAVDATIGGDTKEKVLEAEMNTTCESVVSPKDECAEAKQPFEAEIKHLTSTNESEVVTGEVGTKGKIAS